MAQPTPKTVHLVMAGVTQMEPMMGDAAMRSAKRYSPGEFCTISRMAEAYPGASRRRESPAGPGA